MRTQIPDSCHIILLEPADNQPVYLPKFALNVECGNSTTGFPSPADDYIEGHLDLNEFHNIRKHACFLVMAVGESMIDAGIHERDLLIVDTTLNYRENDVVICCLNDSYKAKVIKRKAGKLYLFSRNKQYPPIEILEQDDLQVFGVVQGLSRNFRRS